MMWRSRGRLRITAGENDFSPAPEIHPETEDRSGGKSEEKLSVIYIVPLKFIKTEAGIRKGSGFRWVAVWGLSTKKAG